VAATVLVAFVATIVMNSLLWLGVSIVERVVS
jgi:hypothetical protein